MMKSGLYHVAIGGAALVLVWLIGSAQAQEKKGPGYAGAASCLCHADPVQHAWQKSKHARAFELLKLAGQEKNEKCLPCHTTGYGRGGYGAAGVTVNLEGVQCEECHGPAEEHVSSMDKTKVNRTPSGAVCARCHQDLDIHATQ
jgi:hypothetical protein